MHYDIFNGDADGICALHMLRMAQPIEKTRLITGVKRDNKLLERLFQGDAAEIGTNDSLTVLDISMDKNKDDLQILLAAGCQIFYADHHYPGDIPHAKNLEAHIDPSSEVCTAVIIDRLLDYQYHLWAVTAAYGDNLHETAFALAQANHLSEEQIFQLRELGELLNYNGYGGSIQDLHFHPRDLYLAVKPYNNPFDFYHESKVLAELRDGFAEDMAKSKEFEPSRFSQGGRIYEFPAEKWSKRVAGIFSNARAREKPDLAHALIVDNGDDTYLVSVRAPLHNKTGADVLCRQFPTGGGRAGAAGINALPAALLEKFIVAFSQMYAPRKK